MDEARRKYQAGELYWAADLMVELEKKQQGKTLAWAIECVKTLVENASPPNKAQFLTWLNDLLSISKADTADGTELMNASQRIWHEQRDVFHTTIAHLYAALAYLSQDNIREYRRSLVTTTDVMGNHEYYRKSSMAEPLTLFLEIINQPAG
jgi:hypothetical protein